MWGQPPPAVRRAKLDSDGSAAARVERTLLSAAFDLDFPAPAQRICSLIPLHALGSWSRDAICYAAIRPP
jgi:hypothetical protein